MRPIYLEFPLITTSKNTDNMFMFGHALLVRPATSVDDDSEL